jgi:PmbA protein
VADLDDIAARVVSWAREGEQVEAVVVRSRETEIRAYDGEIEQLSSAESLGVGIRVISGNRQGFAYAGTLDESVLVETMADARDNAAFGTVDEHLGLAEPDGVAPVALDLYHPGVEALPLEAKMALAIELERAVRAGDPRIIGVESADYADGVTEAAIATTTGIRASSREGSSFLVVYSLAEQDGEVQTGFGFSVGRDPATLDPGRAAADAVERAVRLLGARKPPTGRITVVLDPMVTAELLGVIGETLSGEMVLKGRSLFADRLGEQVASPLLTLVDDPTDPAAFSATAIDGEGIATRRNELIADGRLGMFVHNAYTARRMGTVTTGSAVRGYSSTPGVGVQALALRPGTQRREDLIASIDDGVLVQGVSGLHSGVNPVSGDFSTGADGLRIRNGALAEPVREFTIASTLQRMLQDVVAVGDDLEWLPMNAAGVTLVVADVTMSGE